MLRFLPTFDLLLFLFRIHYPLPLPYMGKPDPAALQKEIRALRAELHALSKRGDARPSDYETRRLRAEYVSPI